MSPEDLYKKKKNFYINEKYFLDIGFNASWGLDLPMGDMQYRKNTWYTPGDLKIYREDDAFKIDEMNIIDLYNEQGFDVSEIKADIYIKKLKKTLIEDLKSIFEYTENSHISEKPEPNLNEIVVLVYENQNIWKKKAGLKYGYFFIREEKGLFYSMAFNGKIYEGSLEELKTIISERKKIVGEFNFFLKWNWEIE